MPKIYENMNAAELPITEIDENAVVTLRVDKSGSIETVIEIKVNDETVRINPNTISLSLESSIASDLWKAYYFPMYQQTIAVYTALNFVARATYDQCTFLCAPAVVVYRTESNDYMIEYQGKKYTLSARSEDVALKSNHPISILQSPVFEVNDPTFSGYHYSITSSMTEFLAKITAGHSIFDQLSALMYGAGNREKFLNQYKLKHQ